MNLFVDRYLISSLFEPVFILLEHYLLFWCRVAVLPDLSSTVCVQYFLSLSHFLLHKLADAEASIKQCQYMSSIWSEHIFIEWIKVEIGNKFPETGFVS